MLGANAATFQLTVQIANMTAPSICIIKAHVVLIGFGITIPLCFSVLDTAAVFCVTAEAFSTACLISTGGLTLAFLTVSSLHT